LDEDGGAMSYRTIVADPPWEYADGCVALGPGHGVLRAAQPLPYESMSLDEIRALPVPDLAAGDARLFMWTTNRYLPHGFGVLDAWGFTYAQTLVWHKTDVNLPGHVAPNSAEFVLVAVRGNPGRLATMPSAVIATPRRGGHSQKRECWLDYFEQVSPGPYVELFARRARFGWDYWGDESLGTATMGEGRGDGNRRAGRAAS
jgi:N6-adenosine-specific RNA methylase IME4